MEKAREFQKNISFCFIDYAKAFDCVVVGGLVTKSCLTLVTPWAIAYQARLFLAWDSPGKNARMGCHFLLQEIFPTQGLNPGPLHCRQMLYHLSHQGSQEAIVRTSYGTTDWFNIEKGVYNSIYCHPVYLTYMQSTS